MTLCRFFCCLCFTATPCRRFVDKNLRNHCIGFAPAKRASAVWPATSLTMTRIAGISLLLCNKRTAHNGIA